MSGGKPLYITAAFIIEEGMTIEMLERIANSMKITAEEAGVKIIAGDTKVAERGKADKVFISTTGIGWIPPNRVINGKSAQPGDAVLISGTIGDHGIAVLAERGKLGFQTQVKSDVAPLNNLVEKLISKAPSIHVLRDPTRGGLATTLNEIATQSKVTITINEKDIPIKKEVQAACEMLGFDPLYVANEGKLITILPSEEAELALHAMHSHPYGKDAKIIGCVEKADKKERVLLKTIIGGTRIVDTLAGEMLPRIC
jgi:hydrogenase expression/formation protein HypE